VARLLQTLSSCRTEYFGRLGMVMVSFGSDSDLGPRLRYVRSSPQQRTYNDSCGMSVWCQQQTRAPQQATSLFDHLIGTGKNRRRDRDA
jgi:hypothetical protein